MAAIAQHVHGHCAASAAGADLPAQPAQAQVIDCATASAVTAGMTAIAMLAMTDHVHPLASATVTSCTSTFGATLW
jgi:hypothetical protein